MFSFSIQPQATIRKLFTKKVKAYTSIEDLPAFNWFKIMETSDLSWLLLNRKDLKHIDESALKDVWDAIFYEFAEAFGISEKAKETYIIQAKILSLYIQLALTKDKSLKTFIKIKELELAELQKQTVGENNSKINSVKVYVERFMGRFIDLKTITVKEFYEYVDAMNSDIEERNRVAQQSHGRE